MSPLEVAALAVMLVAGGWLSVIDIREHRLPNRLTLPLFLGLTLLLAVVAWLGNDWNRLWIALGGAIAMAAVFLALALVPGGMGMGDVKLALSIGLLAAWWSPSCWLLALVLAFVFGALASTLTLLSGRGGWRANIPFGPCLLLGWVSATATTSLAATGLAALG